MKFLTLSDDRLRGRYEARFTLIRPDQHVAWRGDALPADADKLIATVTGAANTEPGQSASGSPRAKEAELQNSV